MIFVHSSFRSGSTYLWSCLRQSPRAVTYYEIFNEALSSLTSNQVPQKRPDTWRSRHPPVAPYFTEYLPLLRSGGGVLGFDASMSFDRFIPAEGCGGPIGKAEADYVGLLITHAEAWGKIPVLTATRSVGRLRGLKAAFPGLHLLLYRNLFQQWCSVTDQAFHGNPYFLRRVTRIIRAGSHDKVLNALGQVFPVDRVSIKDTNTFYAFVLMHLHLYVQAAGAADMIVDMNRLATDPVHRQEVEQRIAHEGVAVDLSGARNSTTFSLCQLGSGAQLRDRMRMMADIIIDRAPDSAGRILGARMLSDLLEEHDRHEFHTAALRSILLRPEGLLAKQKSAIAEHETKPSAPPPPKKPLPRPSKKPRLRRPRPWHRRRPTPRK